MLSVVVPDSRKKIELQIKVLKNILGQDTREKDRQIHKQAKTDLENALGKI